MNNRDKARVLSEREKGRDVSVWFESKANFIHPLKELVANATDEINNNFEKGTVTVKLDKDMQTLTIKDTGRGIPLELTSDDGTPYYKIFLLILFGGTNFENGENGKITTGEHGLGLTVSNYCSKYFHIESYREKIKSSMTFIEGGEIKEDFKIEDNNTGITGTHVTFKLDEDVFGEYKYDKEQIKTILNQLAGSNNKIKMIFEFGDEEHEEYHYDSIEEYFDTITNNNTSAKVIGLEKEFTLNDELNRYELVMSTSSEPVQESFLNITFLPKGGTINRGIFEGVRNYINKYCKTNKLFKNKTDSISIVDVEDSISFICNVMSVKSEFANQTKLSTEKPLYRTIAIQYVQELLELFELENSQEFKKFANHIIDVHNFNSKSEANKKALKKKLNEKVTITSKIPNLIECKSKNKEENILCICEGQSALGSLMSGRGDIHALYPLRGKILNCFKAKLDKILKNDVVLGVQRSLGCGIEVKSKENKDLNTFDINNLRYSKIYIIVDQDFDGIGSILPLLLSMFQTLNPTLIKEGRIYVCETPKYEVSCNNKEYYAINDDELQQLLSNELKDKKYEIHYIKGLAELSSEAMALCLSEGYQNITQITLKDVEKSLKTLDLFMGEKVNPRKDYILSHFEGRNN